MKDFATYKSVEERLEKKSSIYDYGNLKREITTLSHNLQPLLEGRGYFELRKFVDKVNTTEMNEFSSKAFDKQFLQLKSEVKELSIRQAKDLADLASRVSDMEDQNATIREDFLEVKFMAENMRKNVTR